MCNVDWYQKALSSLGWIEVTKWARVDRGFEHNHIELGHVSGTHPNGNKDQTKDWKSGRWSKLHTYALKDSKPLKML